MTRSDPHSLIAQLSGHVASLSRRNADLIRRNLALSNALLRIATYSESADYQTRGYHGCRDVARDALRHDAEVSA